MTSQEELQIVEDAVSQGLAEASSIGSPGYVVPGVLRAGHDLTVWQNIFVGSFIAGGVDSLIGEYHIAPDGLVEQVSF